MSDVVGIALFGAVVVGVTAVVVAAHVTVSRQLRPAETLPPERTTLPAPATNIVRELQDEIDTKITAIVDHATDGVWDWRIPENVEYMSPRFKAILGYEPHELPDVPEAWMKLIHPDDLKVALANFDAHVRTRGAHPYDQVVRYRHKAGHEVTVLCRGVVTDWGPEGEPLRMIGTHVDLTGRGGIGG